MEPKSQSSKASSGRREASQTDNGAPAAAKDPVSQGEEADMPRPPSKVLFEYPAIPALESAFYFVCTIFNILWGVWLVYQASAGYYQKYNPRKIVPTDWSFLGSVKDTINFEWNNWHPYARRALPFFIGHSILFNKTERILGRLWSPFMLIYWIASWCILTTPRLVLVTIAQGIFVYLNGYLMPHWTSVWSAGALNLCFYLNFHTGFQKLMGADYAASNRLLESMLITYKQLQYISFNLEHIEKPRKEDNGFFKGLYRMLWYSFYLPYSVSIVCIYRRFCSEIDERCRLSQLAIRRYSTMKNLFFGLRIWFYYLAVEFILHHIYFESMLRNTKWLQAVPLHLLVHTGYTTGLFFHVRYVIIFGFCITFARFDNMNPPDPPACISRITLYSKMWRNFDRGLYGFFKEHIFVPICRPTFSFGRKLLGLFVSYSFVVLWHGGKHHIFVWIYVNVFEMVLEYIAKALYASFLKAPREAHISDQMFRRIVAWLQVCPLAIGTYGIFYFLGGARSGWIFVDRVFWGQTVTLKPFFLGLILFGYCFNNCSMDAHRWLEERQQKAEKIKLE